MKRRRVAPPPGPPPGRAEERPVRFMYFAPWWLYVLRSGKRFSLRRTLGSLLLTAILAEAIGSGWRYAFGGDRWAPLHALTTSGEILAAVALYLTIEPLLFVLRDSVVGAGIHTSELHRTSIGFTAWCAAVAAAVTWYVTPRVPILTHVREQLERVTDPHDAIVRFVIGSFIVWLVVLFVVRAAALAFDGTSFTRATAPPFVPGRPQPPPFVVPPTIGPGAPHAGRLPQPGRIVSSRVDPARRDRNS